MDFVSDGPLPGMPLIPGEKGVTSLKKDLNYICPNNGSISGILLVTNYKLFFYGSYPNEKTMQLSVQVPLCTISHVEKFGGTTTSRGNEQKNTYGFSVFCKDLRVLKFTMNHESKQRKLFVEKLQELCFPMSYKAQFFAFSYEEKFSDNDKGWSVYEPEREFKRQGLPNDKWRLTLANEKYELCDTYPKLLFVPVKASNDFLSQAAQFRSRCRIPVLSWIHPKSEATISRCSQPLVGLSSKRNKDDESYLTIILETNPHAQKLLIFDARPQANAYANLARGGGWEKVESYNNTELVFCDIHNIHVMRESLKKMQEACDAAANDDKHWYSNLEHSQWLHHAKLILTAATCIADRVENDRMSVLVHCSDGWDRTAQLTSLSMIMLDSYYRTIEGFEVLVEKEWISMGHKFAQRIGHGDKNHSDSERSPVFLQFIDCVWQIMQQFPTAFEFNEQLLVFILDHLYSCLFGNFLYNCDRERTVENVKEKTKSMWSLVAANRDIYVNPRFMSILNNRVLLPIAAVRHLKFWKSFYGRWSGKSQPQKRCHHMELSLIRDRLRDKVEELRRRKLDRSDVKQTAKPRVKVSCF